MCFRGHTLRTASSCSGGVQVVFEFFRAVAILADTGNPLQSAVYLVERDNGGAGEDYAGCAIFSGTISVSQLTVVSGSLCAKANSP